MTRPTNFASAYGSRGLAVLRIAGFFALIFGLVPVHLVYRMVQPGDRYRMPKLFHRLLMKILGFQIRTHGAVDTRVPALYVANHASYLDIPVLATLIPAAFVAKSEVANWPLIGWLAKLQNTVFIERRSTDIGNQRGHLQVQLAKGRSLIIFPEGTSTDGLQALPFKSSLFSIVEGNGGVTVQPVSIVCTGIDGVPITRALRPFYAWYGDMTLVPHLWDVFTLGGFTVDVIFHPAVTADSFPDRKALAKYCHQQVAHGIEQCLKGRELVPPMPKKRLPVAA